MDEFVLSRKQALGGIKNPDNNFVYVRECNDILIESHGHDFLEIVYITHGTGKHYIGNESYSVKPRDIFIISPGVTHSFDSDDLNNPLSHYDCLLFLDDATNNVDFNLFADIASDLFYNLLFPQDVNRVPYIFLKDSTLSIRRLFTTMADETMNPMHDTTSMLYGCAIELLILLRRLYNQQFDENPIVKKRRDGVHAAIQYLENNYTNKITLNELSRIALFAPNYLCTIFKETTGMSITEYIQQIRNNEATRLLLSTNMTVRDICEQVGYSDERLFRRVFIKSTGYTPGEYRKVFKG